MKIKVCGITNLEDGLACIDAGVDLLGFNFYTRSPRYIDPQQAACLVADLRTQSAPVATVGVFVNSSAAEIENILNTCAIDLAQLSGDEPPEVLLSLGDRAFKALRPNDLPGLERLTRRYPPRTAAPAYLVDSYQPGQFGGTGQTADWSLAQSLAGSIPILLAGGLTPENVSAAVRQVKPWGVDVASGVEISPGRKDPHRVTAFVKAARSAFQGFNIFK